MIVFVMVKRMYSCCFTTHMFWVHSYDEDDDEDDEN
jgi:hypothetical protein